MRIAYILPSLVNKGPGIVAQTIVRNILDKVDYIEIFYFDEITVLEFPCKCTKIDFNFKIDFNQFDIIHTHGYRPDKYTFYWRREIKHSKSKVLATIHADIYEDLSYSYNRIIGFIFSKVWFGYLKKHDGIIAISRTLKEKYSSKFRNLSMIYNGVDLLPSIDENFVKYEKKILEFKGSKEHLLSTYAAINKRKGLEQLFFFLCENSNFGFVIIGEGSEVKSLKLLSRKLKIESQVLFLPYVVRPYNLLHLFDIYIMPSRSEGFGLAIVEASLMKIPIVCSNIPVFKELFSAEEVDFFELDDKSSIKNAILNAVSKNETKVNSAYLKSLENYSSEKMGLGYFNFYKRMINEIN
jgi:hypothetical protein